jgi:hypothetical protein
MKYRPFSVCWWHKKEMGVFRLSCPFWHSGMKVDTRPEDGAIGYVAAVMATSEEQAKRTIHNAYDFRQDNIEYRLCQAF